MKIVTCILAAVLLFGVDNAVAGELAYDVEAEGSVCNDAVWSGNVIVYGDVLVPPGVTLRIEPGTTVYFAYTESSKIEPVYLSMETELLVRGKLVVEGKPDSPVRFLPAPEEEDLKAPVRGDWGGIIFDGDGASKSSISGAEIVMADIGVSSYYSSPKLEGVTITDCEYGVYAAGGGGPIIKDCVIEGCEYGVMYRSPAEPVLTDVSFKDNAQDKLTNEDGQ